MISPVDISTGRSKMIDIGIPWKVIAASPDMMDITYNNRRFPYAWRSSLAISVFEPATVDLPANLCQQKIAFVKVTCSLTGYQRSGDEADITFGEEPLEELNRLTSEYLGCYGALLNVSFFPPPPEVEVIEQPPDLTQFPYILDFSPKSRELVRAISESGELLTGSSRNVGIDQSLTTTNKSETTVGLEAGYESGGLKATGKISHTWGSTAEDKRGLSVDSGLSEERSQRYTTQLDQLYSLLTGYHSGTNRATFIMLARPGTLQPTNRRTFAPGLRMLEGVQEFIFVVSRPSSLLSLCIEASLNTGHFPEEVQLVGEQEQIERRTFTFVVNARAKGGGDAFAGGEQFNFGSADRPQDTFTLPADENGQWVLDIDAPGTNRGVALVADRTRTAPPSDDGILADDYTLEVVPIGADGTTVQARGRVDARGGNVDRGAIDTIVEAEFRIHAKRPRNSDIEPSADINQMLVTSRSLNVCYRSVEGCPQIIEPARPQRPDGLNNRSEWIDDLIRPRYTRNMPYEQLYTNMRSTLISSTAATAKGVAKRSFAETDHYSRKVATTIPRTISAIQLAQAINLQEYCQGESVLNQLSIGKFLSTELRTLSRMAKMPESQTLQLRRDVLRYIENLLQQQLCSNLY